MAHTKFIPQLRESLVRCPSPPGAASVAAVTANTAWLDDHGTSDEIHVLVLGSSSHRERMPRPGHLASLHV